MDVQIAHRLQTEKQAKEQHYIFQTAKVNKDSINQEAQAPHTQNRQNSLSGQVRYNGYSGYNQDEERNS